MLRATIYHIQVNIKPNKIHKIADIECNQATELADAFLLQYLDKFWGIKFIVCTSLKDRGSPVTILSNCHSYHFA